jgi:uncharacterized protein (DUF362 family)
MHEKRPCGGLHRRGFLATAAAALPSLAALHVTAQRGVAADVRSTTLGDKLGVPGPFPGRVVEVRNATLCRAGKKNREAFKTTLARGMKELVGSDDAVSAWRAFFEPGDVVGIKVVPNGMPAHPTSIELVLEIIEALKSAGVKTKDMIVFDRYASELKSSRIPDGLPTGIAWGGLTPLSGGSQTDIKFPGNDPIAGYDPDEFTQMSLLDRGADAKNDRNWRSHLGLLVTKRVNKLVLLPCLKDHGSAGVTGALKNISHGLVNNVNRSHSSANTNACNIFIPQSCSHPILRKKCVLQIMDGSRGIWQGGPFGFHPEWVWDYNALLFATDPVALDHVEWDIIDAKRKENGVPGVGAVGLLAANPFQNTDRGEGFDVRQPQHISLAGNLGLGIFDYKSPLGRRHAIEHRVVKI